jgi:four helix bundle protein
MRYNRDEPEGTGATDGWMLREEKAIYDIRERLFQFAVKIVKLVRTFPRTLEAIEIGRQLLAAGTSIGANYEEAEGAQSRRDFVAKASISRKEARESRFWLRLIQSCEIGNQGLASELYGESDQIVRILSSIIKRAGQNN